MKGPFSSLVMRRLGGNRHLIATPNDERPLRPAEAKRVAIIGGGIAGITAAALLAERGFRVTLFEKSSFLGGKAGSWIANLADGYTARIDHGFHGFFRQYHNLRAMMDRFDASRYLVPIDDYLISAPGRGTFRFKNVAKTPLLNMISLRKTGLYRLRDMMAKPESRRLLAFLSYDPHDTFAKFDDVSFEDFSNAAGIPHSMRTMFNTFSRSFFADPDLMSSAEVIKSFHFYFLSNDLGLLYDYLAADFETGFTAPARRYLERNGAELRLSTSVERIDRNGNRLEVLGVPQDFVILAADVDASRRIVMESDFIRKEDPETLVRMGAMKPSQGYAVLKVWLDRNTRADVPPFIATEREHFLDSITLSHRVDAASAAWAHQTQGGIFELHSYALPKEGASADAIRNGLLSEMSAHLPDLKGARVIHEHLSVRSDFTAFHVGMNASRPVTATAIPELLLAGDWVKLPIPAMLMEAACSSAMFAANVIFDAAGLRREPIWSVPVRGLFAPRLPVSIVTGQSHKKLDHDR